MRQLVDVSCSAADVAALLFAAGAPVAAPHSDRPLPTTLTCAVPTSLLSAEVQRAGSPARSLAGLVDPMGFIRVSSKLIRITS
ncbi:unnamed protein product [Haemonchus placei]|uniref:Secreted protein n=1 Tax=Haemonchus placei TaxID=6290 RepID=A0A0N4WR98_HAEPC|nr:unnamed protein product [Haemonchus placei]